MPSGPPWKTRGLVIRDLTLLQPLDLVMGVLVLVFFLFSALLRGGEVAGSLLGGALIMIVMFVVGAAIEVIIESLRDIRGLGTAVGFITNGPEALCLIVGLISGDIVFAASTPLGSNFMNPMMLVAAALVSNALRLVFGDHRLSTIVTLGSTAALAGTFFLLPERQHLLWMGLWLAAAVVLGFVLFRRRPGDPGEDSPSVGLRRWHAVPAVVLLVIAGYWLDPVVSFTAERSAAPKGAIGFFVLAALTSWPEFRSCLTLLRRRRTTSAVLNITVSNITNLWLASAGVAVYLVLQLF